MTTFPLHSYVLGVQVDLGSVNHGKFLEDSRGYIPV